MNVWDFRSIASIVEHEGVTLVQFLPGTSIDAVTRKILDLGYAREEFELLPGSEPGLVDFRVFSDEEFPIYLCLSQIFNEFPFTAVTIEGDVFPGDVKEIDACGGRFLDEVRISFETTLHPDQQARIQQSLHDHGIFVDMSMIEGVLGIPVIRSSDVPAIVQAVDSIARAARVHGKFTFGLDLP